MIVSISLPKQIADKIDSEKKKQGFSTRSEYIRSLIREHFEGKEEVIYLSKAAAKRYDRITKDFEEGKNVFTANDVDDLLRQLHEDPRS